MLVEVVVLIMRPDKQVFDGRKRSEYMYVFANARGRNSQHQEQVGRMKCRQTGGSGCGVVRVVEASDTGKWNMKSAIDESGIGSNSA